MADLGGDKHSQSMSDGESDELLFVANFRPWCPNPVDDANAVCFVAKAVSVDELLSGAETGTSNSAVEVNGFCFVELFVKLVPADFEKPQEGFTLEVLSCVALDHESGDSVECCF